jgi:hypothetical protein
MTNDRKGLQKPRSPAGTAHVLLQDQPYVALDWTETPWKGFVMQCTSPSGKWCTCCWVLVLPPHRGESFSVHLIPYHVACFSWVYMLSVPPLLLFEDRARRGLFLPRPPMSPPPAVKEAYIETVGSERRANTGGQSQSDQQKGAPFATLRDATLCRSVRDFWDFPSCGFVFRRLLCS